MKSGVGIMNDINKINNSFNILCNNIIDLMELYRDLYGIGGKGLEKLSCEFLGIKKLKIPVNHYKWDRKTLSNQQISYACGDAWASREILPSMYYMFQPNEITKENLFNWINSVDKKYINYKIKKDKIQYKTKKNDNSCRTKPLYENCQIYIFFNIIIIHLININGPDGNLLFESSRRKVEWYLRKGLGKIISESPFSIQINFVPSKVNEKVEFCLTPNDNRCAVCGVTDNYNKHSIIPHFYKQFFPLQYKSRCCHDIILLCV